MGQTGHHCRRHRRKERQPPRSCNQTEDILRLWRHFQEQLYHPPGRSSGQGQEGSSRLRIPRSQHRATLEKRDLSSILDVLRSIRRSTRGPLSCPQCRAAVKRSRAPLEGWILPTRYLCDKCGYSGFLALEEERPEK